MQMYFEYMSNVYGENWKKDYKNGIIPSKKSKINIKIMKKVWNHFVVSDFFCTFAT